MILHRSTGEHDAIFGLQLHGNARSLCSAVFDYVGFIEHSRGPLLAGDFVFHGEQESVCGDDDVSSFGISDAEGAVL